MNIEGKLQIDLYPVAGQENRVHIQSSRPLQAARVFEGKPPEEVLQQLPLLFSVCGIAQAAAAAKALRQALDIATAVPVDAARGVLILMETAREHLWRILADWPAFLEEPVDARAAAPLQALLPVIRKALFVDGNAFSLQAELRVDEGTLRAQIDQLDGMLARLVFGEPAQVWLQLADLDDLADWSRRNESVAARLTRTVCARGWQGSGAADCGILPELPDVWLNRQLEASGAERFIAAPQWEDRPCETTPLARHCDAALVESLCREYGNGLLTRLAARLVELAQIPARMRELDLQTGADRPEARNPAHPAGVGIGQVEAARGRLVHRVVLDGGVVQRYQILAPTEWNFHPAGVVSRGLALLPDSDADTLQRQAAMLINTVDPCVGYDLQVH
ncbi:MAG TPA: nickel-dependent hydrogenase large subunit [Gammaproteobacteria bacterium]|nr:nickel-dependent hydrogenase large subunit [Gammaproteobacteria bacterium]